MQKDYVKIYDEYNKKFNLKSLNKDDIIDLYYLCDIKKEQLEGFEYIKPLVINKRNDFTVTNRDDIISLYKEGIEDPQLFVNNWINENGYELIDDFLDNVHSLVSKKSYEIFKQLDENELENFRYSILFDKHRQR